MSDVRDNQDKGRFELATGGAVAFIEYTRHGTRIALNHTEVPEALSGQGIGSRLVRGVLDDLQAAGLKVIPRCPFVAKFIAGHPEYQDLVAAE